MTGGFGVIHEALRAAAATARSAGEAAGEVDLGSTAEKIAGALPGSSAAATSGELAQVWRSAVTSWSAEVTAHGDNLEASAQRYHGTDQQAEERLTAVERGLVL